MLHNEHNRYLVTWSFITTCNRPNKLYLTFSPSLICPLQMDKTIPYSLTVFKISVLSIFAVQLATEKKHKKDLQTSICLVAFKSFCATHMYRKTTESLLVFRYCVESLLFANNRVFLIKKTIISAPPIPSKVIFSFLNRGAYMISFIFWLKK